MAAVKLTKKEQEEIAAANSYEAEEADRKRRRIEMRTLLQKAQPEAFALLERSFAKGAVSHGYLFYGPTNALKTEMAMLCAETLVTRDPKGLVDESSLSDEEEALVRQVANRASASLIVLDGYGKKALAKENVDDVQSRFSRTASSGNGARIWLMLRCENSSLGAQNSLLKFLEEPADGVYAFLTADNVERVLPTIRSRCVLVPFRPLPEILLYEEGQKQGLDQEDAWLLAHMKVSISDMVELAASPAYQNAKAMLKQWLNVKGDRDLLACDYEVRYRLKAGAKKDEGISADQAKDQNVRLLRFFFEMLMVTARTALKASDSSGMQMPAWYALAIGKNSREDWINVLKIAGEERDRVNANNDLNLLLDQAFYRLEVSKASVTHG